MLIIVPPMASHNATVQGSQHELYYIALTGYTPNYWNSDTIIFDANGIPMVDYGDSNPRYNPTTIAQYGLSLFNAYLDTGEQEDRDKFDAVVDYLLHNYEVRSTGIAYPFSFPLPAYGLKPGWISALAQGQILSVLRRAYSLNPDQHFVDMAMGVKSLMLLPVTDGGTLATTPEGELWLEESPSITPSLILNGNMFAIIGLYDYVQMVPNDTSTAAFYSRLLRGVERSIGYYDTERWLLYDRYRHANIQQCYLNIYIQLVRHFYFITADPFYDYLAAKWNRYTAPPLPTPTPMLTPLPTPTLVPTTTPPAAAVFIMYMPLVFGEME